MYILPVRGIFPTIEVWGVFCIETKDGVTSPGPLDVSRFNNVKFFFPKDPLVCPKNPGFPRSNPMTWGWDVSTINPTLGKGLDS